MARSRAGLATKSPSPMPIVRSATANCKRAAAGLPARCKRSDCGRKQRLGLLLYDTVDFPVAFWGGVRAGIVVLPLNTLLNAEQYAYILGDSRTAAIVASASLAKTLVPVLDRLPHLRTIILVGADRRRQGCVPRPRRA